MLRVAPGPVVDCIRDEPGALRRHVNLRINHTVVIDRENFTDRAQDKATVFIFQALSGG